MFLNELTEKMPCWRCKNFINNDEASCPILQGFVDGTNLPNETTMFISGLTFECDRFVEGDE